jgi:uncharacterized glyoxalase superfamily metalloenzyme YdcJ
MLASQNASSVTTTVVSWKSNELRQAELVVALVACGSTHHNSVLFLALLDPDSMAHAELEALSGVAMIGSLRLHW